jgi:hypothetical protein
VLFPFFFYSAGYAKNGIKDKLHGRKSDTGIFTRSDYIKIGGETKLFPSGKIILTPQNSYYRIVIDNSGHLFDNCCGPKETYHPALRYITLIHSTKVEKFISRVQELLASPPPSKGSATRGLFVEASLTFPSGTIRTKLSEKDGKYDLAVLQEEILRFVITCICDKQETTVHGKK